MECTGSVCVVESLNDILGGDLQEGSLTPLLLTGQRQKSLFFSHRQHTQLLSLSRAGTWPDPWWCSQCVQVGETERWLSPELVFRWSKSTVALPSLCISHDMGWDLEEWRGRTAPYPKSQILEIQPDAQGWTIVWVLLLASDVQVWAVTIAVGHCHGTCCSPGNSNPVEVLGQEWISAENHKSKSQSSSKTSQIIFIEATKCLTHFKIFLESIPMTKPCPCLQHACRANPHPSPGEWQL